MLSFILGFPMFLSDGKTKRPVLENSLSDMTVTVSIFFPVNIALANEQIKTSPGAA